MITDYGSFLRVTEDGHIWWLLSDALRLGAGYLLVRDDHQALAPELRAPSNRALMNERTLIGAFGDTRLTIERPMTFERDRFRYVDAEGFLSWLSQYIAQTQAEISFPNELAREIVLAKAKAAASQPPVNRQEFESLTLVLADWFDNNLKELPLTLRQRVEREFSPIPWDELSAEQRRSLALQLDYQRDPATEQDRQYWWNFFVRLRELQAQKKQWQSAATPTASDISLKESRLKELQQEIDRMELQQSQARGDYYPGRKSPDADRGTMPSTAYIAYPKAMKILREKWNATPEELAAWIFLGPDLGGVAAYCNANELNPPPRFYLANCFCEDYLSPLMACWFQQDDIDRFQPADRYITGATLIERWSKQPSLRPEGFIRAKIAESRLLDLHPTYGGTQGTFDNDTSFPPLSAGLFSMKQVELIEVEDALAPATFPAKSGAVSIKNNGKGGRPVGPLRKAVEMAYNHFRKKGDVAILQPHNIRSFMKSFASLTKDEALLEDGKKWNIKDSICMRIKEVKIPRGGKCFVTTQDRTEGNKIIPGRRYSQDEIAKLLTDLRKKYPLSP